MFQQVENVETSIGNSETENVDQIIFLLFVLVVVVLAALPDTLDRGQHGLCGRRGHDDDGGVRVVQLKILVSGSNKEVLNRLHVNSSCYYESFFLSL